MCTVSFLALPLVHLQGQIKKGGNQEKLGLSHVSKVWKHCAPSAPPDQVFGLGATWVGPGVVWLSWGFFFLLSITNFHSCLKHTWCDWGQTSKRQPHQKGVVPRARGSEAKCLPAPNQNSRAATTNMMKKGREEKEGPVNNNNNNEHPGYELECSQERGFASGTCVCNDPSAGSPTETLLRLLLPLNDKVR